MGKKDEWSEFDFLPITVNSLYSTLSTYMYFHCAGLWADVGTCECEWFPAHLTKLPHKGMIWDTYTYKLRKTWMCKQQFTLRIKQFIFSTIQLKRSKLTEVKGFRSVFSSSDLSNTRVTGPGSRSPNSSFFTFTLQYLHMTSHYHTGVYSSPKNYKENNINDH